MLRVYRFVGGRARCQFTNGVDAMITMRLWELNLTKLQGLPTYEIVNKFIVRATSARQARKLASEKCIDEGPDVWLDPTRSSCSLLKQEGKAGVIAKEDNAS